MIEREIILLLLLAISIYVPTISANSSGQIITIIIEDIEMQNILYTELLNIKGTYPDTIILNGNIYPESNTSYILTNENINTIILQWNKSLTDCSSLFYNCYNISEVDLSNFDSSLITNTDNMFYNCTSLTSINFTNFITPSLYSVHSMFKLC